MKYQLGLAAIAAALVGFGGVAVADTVSYSANYGPATPNYTQQLPLDKFHGNLADLISVRFELSLNIAGGFLCVDNDGADPATVNVNLGADASITSTDVTLLDSLFQPVTGTASAATGSMFNLGGDNGDGAFNVDCNPLDGAIHLGGMASDANAGFIHPLFHPQYVGAGTFNVDLNALQILDFGSVGGVEGSFSPVMADGEVKVTYEYVPEPAAFGVLALGWLLIRRKGRHA
jgi:hypothetical protein